MTAPPDPPHVLIYEPRTEGHHLVWLRYFMEDLLGAGVRLTLALDQRPAAWERIQAHLRPLLAEVTTLPIFASDGSQVARGHLAGLAACQRHANADSVFLPSLDEIASACFRRAALGWLPAAALKGRLGGVYFRPRMLLPARSPNQLLKRAGFRRLLRQRWFRQILLCDEYLCAAAQARHPDAPLFFLPDPFPDGLACPRTEARRALRLPEDKTIFLFYGGPYRRKGLPLAVEAMLGLPADCGALLLCVGEQPQDEALSGKLASLSERSLAHCLGRRVSNEEEKAAFAACDFVLLPYLQHFGSSAVLARAAGAGRIPIASDEELIGRRVRDHGLGLLFASGDAGALRECLRRALQLSASERAAFTPALARYASTCTREKFREAVLRSFGVQSTGLDGAFCRPREGTH
jgi:glycosyltransferase involved in cell wall biosynthesis